MRIKLSSVFADDQEKALRFYTDVELLLEPNDNPAAETYQRAIYEQRVPSTANAVEDFQKEYERLKDLGVAFRSEREAKGPTIMAVFEDICGNLIQIYQD